MKCPLFVALSALVVSVGRPAALSAQEARDTVELTTVVVTATRLAVPRDAVAASVTVIPGAELRAQGVRTVFEALRRVVGAMVIQTGSFGGQTSLFLRGGESDYVKVLIDGVAVNEPGGAFDFADLTTDNVDRIEIVRGPVSVLYGSDAVTGVIQIFTRPRAGGAERSSPNVAVGFRAGFFDRAVSERGSAVWEWAGEVAGGTEMAGYALSLSRLSTEGLYDFNNDYRNTVLSGRVRLAPTARTEASVALRYTDNVFHFPTDGGGALVDRNAFHAEEGTTLAMEVGRFLTPRVEARLVLGLHETDGGFTDEPDTTGSAAFFSRDKVRRASAGVRANVHLDRSTVLTAGAEFERESQRGRSESQGSFGTFLDSIDVRRRNGAVFAQSLAGVRRALALNAGARLEDNEQFGAHVTYRLGAAYRLGGATRVRASAGTGFKEPTFFENYARGFVRGNPDLDPERSRSWEVGVEHTMLGRLALSLTYFDQEFQDLIEFTFSPAPPDTTNYFNVAGATANGVEAGIELAGWSGVVATANYTYLDTRVTDPGFDTGPDAAFAPGKRLLRRPTHAANLSLGLRSAGRGSVSLGVKFVGRRDDLDFSTFPAPRVRLPAYTRVDLAGEYPLFRGRGLLAGLTVNGRVENLFDRRYEEVKNFPARGRTVFFGGAVRLGP